MPRKREKQEDVAELPPQTQQAVRKSLPQSVPDLGAILAVKQRSGSLLQQPGLLVAIAGLGVVIAGILWSIYPTLRPDEQTPMLIFAVACAVIAAVCTALAAYLATMPFYSRGEHWVFCRDGLVRVRWGRRAEVYPWLQLQVRKPSANPASREYELSVGGEGPVRLKFGLVGGGLIKDIQDHQVRFARPALLKAIGDGEKVKFGGLKLSRHGLHFRKEVLPLADVGQLEFTSDPKKDWDVTLTIKSRKGVDSPWASVNVCENLPNAWLFLALVSELEPRLARTEKETKNLKSWLA